MITPHRGGGRGVLKHLTDYDCLGFDDLAGIGYRVLRISSGQCKTIHFPLMQPQFGLIRLAILQETPSQLARKL